MQTGSRWLGALARPRAHLWLTAAALLLVAPALSGGLLLDDHVLRLLAQDDAGVRGLHADPLFLFSFTSGRPADNHALMDEGALLPWWSDAQHLNAFFRPLASLSHVVDFALWPRSAVLMHLHSLAWFAALLLIVAHLYRRLTPAGDARAAAVAALAFALFALDEAHGMTVAWIANRNALISAALSLPALCAHHRWLALGWRPGLFAGPACFALGLCAGETAVAVFGYLLAYTALLDRAPLARRALHLAPYLLLLLAWRGAYALLGLGSAGSGAYHDPGREPLAYALALLEHLPVLLGSQLAVPLADAWFWGAPELHLPIWLLSCAAALAVLGLGHVLLAHDREARFWTAGMLLSACAVAASVPGERLLLVPGVGGAALIAAIISKLLGQPALWQRAALCTLLLLHAVAAPLGLPVRAASMNLLAATLERVDRSLPDTRDLAGQTVVVLAAPFDLMVSYVQPARAARGAHRPAHLHWLATASSAIEVVRSDARSLRVRPERGFVYGAPERHYRGDPSALRRGATVELSEMTVRILEVTPDNRPAVAEFRFREPLESARYRFMRHRNGRLEAQALPAPGERLVFPRADFFTTLLAPLL